MSPGRAPHPLRPRRLWLGERTDVPLIETYRDDVLKLQDLIDRDLSAWLRASP